MDQVYDSAVAQTIATGHGQHSHARYPPQMGGRRGAFRNNS